LLASTGLLFAVTRGSGEFVAAEGLLESSVLEETGLFDAPLLVASGALFEELDGSLFAEGTALVATEGSWFNGVFGALFSSPLLHPTIPTATSAINPKLFFIPFIVSLRLLNSQGSCPTS
jgi:hypothetical protein